MRMRVVLTGLIAFSLGALAVPLIGPAQANVLDPSGGCVRPSNDSTVKCTFVYQGSAEAWSVPSGVTSVSFDVYGAQGFSAYPNALAPVVGGKGGRVNGQLAVSPGDQFTIAVGGKGFNSQNPSPGGGGFGGGGNAHRNAGGGGGASSVNESSAVVFIAGGGGGSSLSQNGGAGGGPDGLGGETIPRPADSRRGEGGQGATQSAPGAGGPGTPTSVCGSSTGTLFPGNPGGNGSSLVGGTGGNLGSGADGGGGGGGWFGGGGGAGGVFCGSVSSGGGGGGGSSQIDVANPNISGVTYASGVREGNGLVTVTYTSADPDGAPSVTINQTSGQADPTGTGPILFTAVFSQPVTGFTGGDVDLGGTAGGTLAASVTEVAPNDGTAYSVSVTGMTTGGSVTADVPAGAATDDDYSTNTASTSTDNTVSWQPDAVGPTASPTFSPAANGAGWNNSDVTVTWNWSDETDGSGIDPANCTTSSTSSGEGASVLVSATCKDLAGNTGSDSVTLKIDKTAPTASPTASPAANGAGWNNTDVTVTWTWSDGGSGPAASCPTSTTSTGEGASVQVSATCVDVAGNSTTLTRTFKIDKTAPSLAPSASPDPVILGGSVATSPNATDSLSDVASQSCTNPGTASIGVVTYQCSAADNAGNTNTASGTYTVGAFFNGFTSPLPQSFPPKAGSTIPVKFTLRDANGPLSASASAALAASGQVRVQLIGPGASSAVAATAACTWSNSNATFQCSLKAPKSVLKGVANPYRITVQEKGLTGLFFTAPGAGNPLSMYFK